MRSVLHSAILGCLLISQDLPALACTLWGIAGEQAPATLIAKNRDWRPDHQQSLRLVRPHNGLPYVGLFADNGRAPGLKAGINEAGLVIVSASASSLSRQKRDESTGQQSVMRHILRDYRQLDQVAAAAPRLFTDAKPMFLLLADRHGLMQVEIGLNGQFSVKRQDQGWLAHTNHYADPALADGQQNIGESSEIRLTRVRQLLTAHQGAWQLADLQQISHDQHDGPNNSLWRTGIEHTLASWQVALPQHAPPILSIRLANPGKPVVSMTTILDSAFWQRSPWVE